MKHFLIFILDFLGALGVLAVQLGLILAVPDSATAQEFPSKPIRMVVPYAPGGNADIQARIFGQKLVEAFGQQVIIDNRAGAGGVIGTDVVAKAPPDGYTLAFVAVGHAINPGIYPKLPFDTVRDFAAIGLVSSAPNLVVMTNALPAKRSSSSWRSRAPAPAR